MSMRLHSLLLVMVCSGRAAACIWDSDTLFLEKHARPKMAKVILDPASVAADDKQLLARIDQLRADPKTNSAAWWNELAGANLRLGRAQAAVDLLKPVVESFPNDYGMHANLGTAYHLLGRYAEAERHIARDLELNPDGHFGLERYHLALLQYLARPADYQSRHLYIDEWTGRFFRGHFLHLGKPAAKLERGQTGYESPPEAINDVPPPYRYQWDLAGDPKCEEGLIYMASLNPGQPACFVMLGVKCLANHDLNLAAAAYERAIQLGSPQRGILLERVSKIRAHIRQAQRLMLPFAGLCAVVASLVLYYLAGTLKRVIKSKFAK